MVYVVKRKDMEEALASAFSSYLKFHVFIIIIILKKCYIPFCGVTNRGFPAYLRLLDRSLVQVITKLRQATLG